MRYERLLIMRITGVSHEGEDLELVVDDNESILAVLSARVDSFCDAADYSSAVGRLLLSFFAGPRREGTFKENIQAELDEIKDERSRRFGHGPFLVVQHSGEVDAFRDGREVEKNGVVVRIGGTPAQKDEIRASVAERITAIVSALALESKQPIGTFPVADSVVFYRENGTPIFSFEPVMSANASVSSPLSTEAIDRIKTWYSTLPSPTVSRAIGLMEASIDKTEEKTRAFVFAWAGLEVFTNKLFPHYRDQAARQLADGEHAHEGQIRRVMKEKPNLVEKFAVIAVQLDPEGEASDVSVFSRVKKRRDAFYHGQELGDGSRGEDARDLLRKYLRLHLQEQLKPAVAEMGTQEQNGPLHLLFGALRRTFRLVIARVKVWKT